MPIPIPKSGENQAKFMARCVSGDIMKKEYPDQNKRTAICISQWKKGGKNMEDVKRDEQGRIIIAENVSVILNADIEVEE